MELSKTERWILWNQYRILALLDPDDAEHHEKMQEILASGYELEYEWKTQHLYSGNEITSAEECNFVIRVFAMYEALQRAQAAHGEQSGFTAADVRFPGFDGNNEGKYLGYAYFLREREAKFTYVNIGHELNSHMPTLDAYTRMLAVWEPLERNYELTAEDMQNVMAARRHPDRPIEA